MDETGSNKSGLFFNPWTSVQVHTKNGQSAQGPDQSPARLS